jgi:hypothetical protein
VHCPAFTLKIEKTCRNCDWSRNIRYGGGGFDCDWPKNPGKALNNVDRKLGGGWECFTPKNKGEKPMNQFTKNDATYVVGDQPWTIANLCAKLTSRQNHEDINDLYMEIKMQGPITEDLKGWAVFPEILTAISEKPQCWTNALVAAGFLKVKAEVFEKGDWIEIKGYGKYQLTLIGIYYMCLHDIGGHWFCKPFKVQGKTFSRTEIQEGSERASLDFKKITPPDISWPGDLEDCVECKGLGYVNRDLCPRAAINFHTYKIRCNPCNGTGKVPVKKS